MWPTPPWRASSGPPAASSRPASPPQPGAMSKASLLVRRPSSGAVQAAGTSKAAAAPPSTDGYRVPSMFRLPRQPATPPPAGCAVASPRVTPSAEQFPRAPGPRGSAGIRPPQAEMRGVTPRAVQPPLAPGRASSGEEPPPAVPPPPPRAPGPRGLGNRSEAPPEGFTGQRGPRGGKNKYWHTARARAGMHSSNAAHCFAVMFTDPECFTLQHLQRLDLELLDRRGRELLAATFEYGV